MTEKNNIDDLYYHKRSEMIYKIIVIGDPAVGKTSLLTNFCGDKFNFEYIPTVGVNITKEKVTVQNDLGKDAEVSLMVWDIAGQPQFYMLHRPYFNGADGMMLVYDVTRSSSFSNINNWYSTAVKYGLSGIPRILIGNKIDLKDEKKIILPMAEHLSQKLNAPFYETSALTGENVSEIFHKIGELTLLSKLQE
ncbi:MAG: Rab family GTPase [Candidatus Thorarchaeota archaeon]